MFSHAHINVVVARLVVFCIFLSQLATTAAFGAPLGGNGSDKPPGAIHTVQDHQIPGNSREHSISIARTIREQT